jgi:anti-sigma B factor antagonist
VLRLIQEACGTDRVFWLDGAVTALEAPLLKQEVRDAIRAGAKKVVLDLADTEFVDSTGLGAFIALHKSTLVAGGELRLRALRPNVKAVLELTRLLRVLRIEPEGPRRPLEPSEAP